MNENGESPSNDTFLAGCKTAGGGGGGSRGVPCLGGRDTGDVAGRGWGEEVFSGLE